MAGLSLIQPLLLTEQHYEYILAGYAAFLGPEKIKTEFEVCFPEAMRDIRSEVDWDRRLLVTIQHLYPGHPQFDQKRWGVLFAGLRRNYLHSVEDSMLSSPRARLRIMEETLDELSAHAAEHPDTFTECKKLQLDVLKQAKIESRDYYKHLSTVDITQEEMRARLRTFTIDQITEFKERHKEGEDPMLIIADIEDRETPETPMIGGDSN